MRRMMRKVWDIKAPSTTAHDAKLTVKKTRAISDAKAVLAMPDAQYCTAPKHRSLSLPAHSSCPKAVQLPIQ